MKGLAAVAIALFGWFWLTAAQADERVTTCKGWKGGNEIRCLSQGAGSAIGGSVVLINPGWETVGFSTQSWKSLCGMSSTESSDKAEWFLPPGGVMEIALGGNAHQSGAADGCTELFVFECKVGGVDTPCTVRLEATLKEQTKWPPGPPRPCEVWGDDGEQLRCLSWSLKQGVGMDPGSVTLERLPTSTPGELTVSLQQWQSQCGVDGGKIDTNPATYWMQPGAKEVFRLSSYSGNYMVGADLCIELIVDHCYLDSAWVKCADHLRATVQ